MRILALSGVAVIAAAALLVPLPWTVAHPGTLVPADTQITLQIDADTLRGRDAAVTGQYLVSKQRPRAPLTVLVVAVLDPAARVVRPFRAPAAAVDPVVAATMAGLGIVPRYADASQLPVTADVEDTADPFALGLALHAFDAGSPIDVARGRRILGVGSAGEDGRLFCTGDVAAAVRAAATTGVDVVVAPTGCSPASDVLPPAATLQVVEASQLVDAADALVR